MDSKKLVPSIGRCATPLISSGRLEPDRFEHGREDVDGMDVLATNPAPPAAPRGQWTIRGSATPPSCTSRFQRRNGVLPATVQPHG